MLAVQRNLGEPVYELREWEISQRHDVRVVRCGVRVVFRADLDLVLVVSRVEVFALWELR